MNGYIFKDGEDPNNSGIMLPRYRVEGRTAPNGNVYPKFTGTPDPNDLVLVRSVVTKSVYDEVVTPDLISNLYTDISDGNPIGLSFSSGLTQSITQKSLSLKHGGHERVLDETGVMRAPCSCTLSTDKYWITLTCDDGKELKYPKPSNYVENTKEKYEKGDIICTAYRTTSPINQLNSLIKLMKAKGSKALRYYEKDDVVISDCYALDSGTIHYQLDEKSGYIRVFIGGREYSYSDQSMYKYPEGTHIRKFQRFCSGVVDMSTVASELLSANDIYQIFREQFYELSVGGYSSSRIIGSGDNREEIVEMTFSSLTNIKSDGLGGVDANYLGVSRGIKNSESFYTLLSYAEASRVVNRAMKGELELKGDIMTNTILGVLLNNNLD